MYRLDRYYGNKGKLKINNHYSNWEIWNRNRYSHHYIRFKMNIMYNDDCFIFFASTRFSTMKFTLLSGFDPNKDDSDGNRLLQYHSNVLKATLLLSAGADINSPDFMGYTVMDFLIYNRMDHSALGKFLAAEGAAKRVIENEK